MKFTFRKLWVQKVQNLVLGSSSLKNLRIGLNKFKTWLVILLIWFFKIVVGDSLGKNSITIFSFFACHLFILCNGKLSSTLVWRHFCIQKFKRREGFGLGLKVQDVYFVSRSSKTLRGLFIWFWEYFEVYFWSKSPIILSSCSSFHPLHRFNSWNNFFLPTMVLKCLCNRVWGFLVFDFEKIKNKKIE
jgi:hypothetical protein